MIIELEGVGATAPQPLELKNSKGSHSAIFHIWSLRIGQNYGSLQPIHVAGTPGN